MNLIKLTNVSSTWSFLLALLSNLSLSEDGHLNEQIGIASYCVGYQVYYYLRNTILHKAASNKPTATHFIT